jgi:excisionase family DNA binding protein
MAADLGSELLTIAESAKLLKVSPVTLGRWLKQGRLPAFHVGPRAVRIRRQDLAALLTPTGTARREGPRPMSIEQFKQTLATPPTPEELARRQALLARIIEHRKEFVIAPLTTADLVHHAREEEYQSYGGDR